VTRILVIDDDPAIRDLLGEALTRAGYEVDKSPDGLAGMELMRARRADLVITDIIMPGKQGVETINELWRDFPGVKVIAISGGGRIHARHYLDTARLFGAHREFTKPIDIPQLLEAVRELTGVANA